MKETSKSRPDLLIVGASTRAAAESAVRANYRPICADCFGDCDLRAIAEHMPIDSYPESLHNLVHQIPTFPWMYTGALENYSGLVDEISNSRPLLGNPARVLERVRDPFYLEQLLSDAGLQALEVRADTNQPDADGNWFVEGDFIDEAPIPEGAFYYLRATTERTDFAWSSPIWVDVAS